MKSLMMTIVLLIGCTSIGYGEAQLTFAGWEILEIPNHSVRYIIKCTYDPPVQYSKSDWILCQHVLSDGIWTRATDSGYDSWVIHYVGEIPTDTDDWDADLTYTCIGLGESSEQDEAEYVKMLLEYGYVTEFLNALFPEGIYGEESEELFLEFVENKGDTDSEAEPSAFENKVNNSTGGDPVALNNGEYTHSTTDFVIKGKALDVEIIRTYGSRREYNGRFGYGWDMNYNMKVRRLKDSTKVILLDGAGNRREFSEGETNKFYRSADRSEYLLFNGEEEDFPFTLVRKHGIDYNFDSNGNLKEIVDRHGNKIIFEYEQSGGEDVLSSVYGPSKYFHLETEGGPEGKYGLIAKEYKLTKIIWDIQNYLGTPKKYVLLDYYGPSESDGSEGLLKSMSHIWDSSDPDTYKRVWTYIYDSNNNLISVTEPEVDGISNVTNYTYHEHRHEMVEIYDAENDPDTGTPYTVNSYNFDWRTVEQIYGESETEGDSTFAFEYDDVNNRAITRSREKMPDESSKSITVEVYNDAGQTVSSTIANSDSASEPAAYITMYEYNANSELTRTILPERNCIDYDYDGRGNLSVVTQRPESDVLPFNGTSDYVQVDDGDDYDFATTTDDFTVALWAKRLQKDTVEYIIDKRDADDDGWCLSFNSSNEVVFSYDIYDILSSTTISDNQWHYIVVTIDRDSGAVEDGTVKIFIDGGLAENKNSTVIPAAEDMDISGSLIIGRSAFSSYVYFKGSLDDVMILGRALDSREGAFGLSEYSHDLVGFWKMDDNTDTRAVVDETENHNGETAPGRNTEDMVADGKVPGEITTEYTYETTYDFIKTVTDPKGNTINYIYNHECASENGLVINEVMANNTSTLEDPDDPGEYPSWIEIYNSTGSSIDLDGMYLSPNLSNPTSGYQIPDNNITISAGGYLVFYADNESAQGDFHTNFTLSVGGGEVGLFDTDGNGNALINSITYEAQAADVSYGRSPDGSNYLILFDSDPTPELDPTPDSENYGQGNGNLIEIIYPAIEVQGDTQIETVNPTVKFTYYIIEDDIKFGRVKTAESPDGIITEYQYYDNAGTDGDNYGRLKKVIVDPSGESIETTYEYDEFGHIKEITNDLSETTEYAYNELDLLEKITYPKLSTESAGFITEMSYNKNKKLKKTEAQLGDWSGTPNQTVEYTYNLLDALKIITDPLGEETENFYDDDENLINVTDAKENGTDYDYDERGLLISITDAESGETKYTYTSNGNLESIEDAKNQITEHFYDAFGRLIQIKYPENFSGNNTTEDFWYDDNGNITCKKTRDDDYIYYEYDAMDKLIAKAVDDGSSSVKTIDDEDAGTSSSSPWTEDTELTDSYDSDCRYNTTADETYTYQVDISDNYSVLMWWPSDADASDLVQVDIYDNDGASDTLLETIIIDQSQNGGKWNNLGAYTFTTTAKVIITASGTVRTYADAVKFVPAVSYVYDVAGRVRYVIDKEDETEFDYDSIGRIEDVTNPISKIVGYEHDNLNRREKLFYPDDSYIEYHYDEMGRLDEIYYSDDGQEASEELIAEYDYDSLSRRTALTYDNGTSITYNYEKPSGSSYELGNRLAKVTNTMDDDTPPTTIIFDYTYDDVGNQLTKTVDSTDVHSYGYDNIYQLLTVDYPATFFVDDTTFDYDSLGNRETMDVGGTETYYLLTDSTQTYSNELNQYGAVGPQGSEVDYSYDNNGNLTDDGTCKYIYDAENRLLEITDQYDVTIVTYEYDYLGRRVKKIVENDPDPDIITKYVYDGEQVIAEYDDSDTLLRKFIYGPGIDEPICMIIPSGQANAGMYYYHYDGLGSVIALSNTDGEIEEQYSYDVYGKPDTTSSIGNPYLFTGRRFDEESNLYYYRARYYSYKLGRYLCPDPIGYYHSMNLYQYCLNNPLNYTDPTGMYERKTAFSVAKIKYITNDGKVHRTSIASAATFKHILMQQKFSGQKITFFEYVGHGFEEGEGLYIGQEGIWAYDISGEYKDLIKDVFDSQAVIELEACQSASGENSIAHKFKEVLPNAKVYGYTGNALDLYFLDETIGNIKPWGKHGKWIEVELQKCGK